MSNNNVGQFFASVKVKTPNCKLPQKPNGGFSHPAEGFPAPLTNKTTDAILPVRIRDR
jgi:hypothetical protein